MGDDTTYTVYSIYVDSCLQQKTGLSIKAMLGNVMESIYVLLQTEENKGLNLGSFRLSKDYCVYCK